jgi:perosamine synthetase
MPELCAAVSLAQTERIQELVGQRIESAKIFAAAVEGCRWLIPQAVPTGYVNSYWTYVVRLGDDAPVSWDEFRSDFRARGGDGVYAAWRINYLEPAFVERNLFANGIPFGPAQREGGIEQEYALGLCPIAEQLQPRLLQFKTNYWNLDDARRQADILLATIANAERFGTSSRRFAAVK